MIALHNGILEHLIVTHGGHDDNPQYLAYYSESNTNVEV